MSILKIFKKNLIIFFCIFFFFSGFPENLILGIFEENNIVDSLYLSLKNRDNIVDNRIGDYIGIKKAKAANFSMQTGYYVGNGSELTIKGLGFKPDFLIIKSNTNAISAVFKTTAMRDPISAYFSPSGDNEASEIVLNNDGFTVGNSDRVKIRDGGFSVAQSMNLTLPNIRYNYIAFTGSDCSATGNFCVGTYNGTGTSDRAISVGFQPSFVMVKRSTAVAAHFKTATTPANNILYFAATVRNTTNNFIKTFDAGGFTVGSSDNAASGLFYFVAFKSTAGSIIEGSFTANNTDNRSITGLGFQPDFVFVKNGTNTTAGNTSPVFNTPESYGDYSSYFAATANAVNLIQALETDGFQVGNNVAVNGSGSDTMYYVAFKGSSSFSASGNFSLQTGSFVGNGFNQNITGLKFRPDLVIVKANTAQQPVFKTSLMFGDVSYILGTGTSVVNAIMEFNNDGFAVGTNAFVNSSGVTYQWQAFGNAFNPHTNSGAADFAIGHYTGNQIDSRNIKRIPFQPDMVLIKTASNYNAAFRTSAMSGDLTGLLPAGTEAADNIQLINSDGFQVGTSATSRAANYSGYVYHWFAFKSGDYFRVGTYSGTGADNRDINTTGIDPEMAWIKRSTNVNGVHRSDSIAGDGTQYFTNTANVTGRIKSFITGGFRLGTGTEVNASGGTYRYAVWKKPSAPVGVPGVPGTPTFSNIESGKLTVNWSAASSADSYKIERAVELGGYIQGYKEIGTTTQTTFTDSVGLGGNFKYWYKVIGINTNGQGDSSSAATVTTPAQSAKIKTGYFVGNHGKLDISGIGFTPEFLIIKSNTNTTAGIFETTLSASLLNADVNSFGATADNLAANVNFVNVTYSYIAFSGNDCSATGSMCVGYYNGNGTNPRDITIGFQPTFAMIKRSTAVGAHYRTASNPSNETLYFSATLRDTTGNFLRSFGATSFQVGTSDNTTGGIYYYVAFKTTAGFMTQGTYTANNTDLRSITGLGFKPNFVIVQNASNSTAANVNPVFNITNSFGDNSSFFSATANELNNIQALEADGFQLGNNIKVNGSTSDTMYYVAFGGMSDPTSSGTFTMANGFYTGNGSKQNITGLAFKPDLVVVKGASTAAVFRTGLMGGDSTGFLPTATANAEQVIYAINSDGFSVGSSTNVNANGTVYHWQAFGNAFNPNTNSGAADFAVGAYYGNGIDLRQVVGVPYSMNLVAVKAVSTTGAGTWRDSNMSGDLSNFFAASPEAANYIQALNSTGFEIGTAAGVNTAAVVYFWFGFKTGTNFKLGGYTGNTTGQTISDVGFESDLLWVKSVGSLEGAFRTSSITDTNSLPFSSAAISTGITAFTSNGFTVSTSTMVNQGTTVYRYAAWNKPIELGNLFVDIVDAGGTTVASPSVSFSASETGFLCQESTATFGTSSQKIRVTNQSGNPQWQLTVAALTGATTTWLSNLSNHYDYNDSSGVPSGCTDGADTDLFAGQMRLDFSGATITPQSGCTNTGVSLGSNSGFSEGSISDILLLQAGASAQTNCYWDITGISLTQVIPGSQPYGTYDINMSLTVTAN